MADEKKTDAPAAAAAAPKFRVVPSAQPPEELYVDGAVGGMNRGGVMKLDLYRVTGVDRKTNTELRRVSHRLVIPAGALPELLRVLQGSVEAARQAVQRAGKAEPKN